MLTIVGGTYLEICCDPSWYELFGSGLRGARALSGHIDKIHFISCVGREQIKTAEIICSSFNIHFSFLAIPKTISFNYYHPLSTPVISPEAVFDYPKIDLGEVFADNILVYGQIEAKANVQGSYVVYDPQNGLSLKETNSSYNHLALVLNRSEASHLSGQASDSSLELMGKILLSKEDAEVVVIKNGSKGALVVDSSGAHTIPVYNTSSVWPIGSGDIFSAVFAWKWAVQKITPIESATFASQFTAQYCDNKILPLRNVLNRYDEIIPTSKSKMIYIAGPFFTISERWLINEIRYQIIEFGHKAFSPFHDVGVGSSVQIVDKDLTALKEADTLLAIISGSDLGTIFEIGYAKALDKKVVILAENIKENDLTMLVGTNCIITQDFSTAIYKACW